MALGDSVRKGIQYAIMGIKASSFTIKGQHLDSRKAFRTYHTSAIPYDRDMTWKRSRGRWDIETPVAANRLLTGTYLH